MRTGDGSTIVDTDVGGGISSAGPALAHHFLDDVVEGEPRLVDGHVLGGRDDPGPVPPRQDQDLRAALRRHAAGPLRLGLRDLRPGQVAEAVEGGVAAGDEDAAGHRPGVAGLPLAAEDLQREVARRGGQDIDERGRCLALQLPVPEGIERERGRPVEDLACDLAQPFSEPRLPGTGPPRRGRS